MTKRIKAIRPIAIVVALSIAQLYVQASLLGPNATNARRISAQDTSVQTGRLTNAPGKSTYVNGNAAQTGETITSGSQITTEAGATVDLGSLGKVDIGPNSTVILTFMATGVDVHVTKGCAILTTSGAVAGTVTGAQGTVQNTNASRRVIDACSGTASGNNSATGEQVGNTVSSPNADPNGSGTGTGTGQGGGAGSGSTRDVIITTIIVAGVAIPIIIHEADTGRGETTSPGSP